MLRGNHPSACTAARWCGYRTSKGRADLGAVRSQAVAVVRQHVKLQGCHPRDLVEGVVDAARYDAGPMELSPQTIDEACRTYFLAPFDDSLPSGLPSTGEAR